jgi:hypothetical protein
MPQPRTQGRAERRTAPTIGTYHGVFFANVADAVEFCHHLVPHIVRQQREATQTSASAVWFHVPPSDGTAHGCWLYLSDGAVRAAACGVIPCAIARVVDRGHLPQSSVLIFGEDRLDPPAPTVDVRRARGSRITSLAVDLPEPDVVLR